MPVLILLFLALAVYLLVMPAVASARASRALLQVERLREEVAVLHKALAERQHGPLPPPLPVPESAGFSVVPPAPVRRRAIRQTESPLNPRQSWGEPPPDILPAAAARPSDAGHGNAPRTMEVPEDPARAAAEPPAAASSAAFSLEQFLGIKLFAWIGGLALFVGVVLFVKYAFAHNLVPPPVRVTAGFVTGSGLVLAGLLMRGNLRYTVLSHTLCATGVLTLYGVGFAGQALYALYGQAVTFGLMAAVTAGAFLLAARMTAPVVAVLGMLGGFLTPVLVSTGRDAPLALFTYIALLDVGLLAVVRSRQWHYLTGLAAAGTGLTMVAWIVKYFHESGYAFGTNSLIPATVLLAFPLLFYTAGCLREKNAARENHALISAAALSGAALLLCTCALRVPALANRPGLLFGFVFLQYLLTGACAWRETRLLPLCIAAGSYVFLLLAAWSMEYLTAGVLPAALALYLVFGLLQAGLPLLWQRWRREKRSLPEVSLWMPLLMLALLLLAVVRVPEASWGIWVLVLMVNATMLTLCKVSRAVAPVVAASVLTMLSLFAWLMAILDRPELPAAQGGEFLAMLSFFSVVLTAGGLWLWRHAATPANDEDGKWNLTTMLPLAPALLPFPLLVTAALTLPGVTPSGILAVALGLAALLLHVAVKVRLWTLFPLTLVAVCFVEAACHSRSFSAGNCATLLLWSGAVWALFLAWPFLFRRNTSGDTMPWSTAAVAGAAQFLFIYKLARTGWPDIPPGLIPALCSLPPLLCLLYLRKDAQTPPRVRLSQLAWFGGVALLFLTLVIPVQWERQWLTLGWALEGAALCWLYRRVPHEGLKLTGVLLLITAFLRLSFNVSVLTYEERSTIPLWNWQLYTYGIAVLAHLAAVKFLAPPRHMLAAVNVRSVLQAQAGILLFLLLNLEIADFFTPAGSPYISWSFEGNFARDMSFSIAWALYALALISWGLWKQNRGARYAGIGLLGVTLAKLFLYDLAHIGSLYRIAALVIVATIALAASFLYQRFATRMFQEPAVKR